MQDKLKEPIFSKIKMDEVVEWGKRYEKELKEWPVEYVLRG